MKKTLIMLVSCVLFLGRNGFGAMYTVTDVGNLGGIGSVGTAINSGGQIVGRVISGNANIVPAFFYDNTNGATDIGSLGGTISVPEGINATGQVVGQSKTSTGANHAFLYSQTSGMIDIGTLGGPSSHGME